MLIMKKKVIACLAMPLLYFILGSCDEAPRISFNQQIRPILNDNCLVCHGGVKQQGGFSLLFPEDAYGPTDSGKPAIIKGNHQKSELYRRLVHPDPDHRMPQEAPPLTEEEIELIAEWIDQGAEWEDHWAYLPPVSMEITLTDHPWIISKIDQLVWDKLQLLELEPETQATPEILARRVSLDLTGLPLQGAAIEQYLENPDSDHYQAMVEYLLESPHFGERWASMWLDLARYADSNGYETDNHRNIWRYRDWVIQAFNSDMPFDQFTIEQLAGDLLPTPTQDQLIATAFNRNTMTNTEGGTIDEEFRLASVMDRLNTTFEVWQSTSIGCVQCHSHPYDPFEHKEYFQLMAYFNNTQDADLSSMAPTLALWEPATESEIRETVDYIKEKIEWSIPESAPLHKQIQEALFPKLIPGLCTDFNHVLINGDGSASNHVVNFSEGLEKRLYFKFDSIPLDELRGISYHFATKGRDARIKVYLDSIDGSILQAIDLPYTGKPGQNIWEYNYHQQEFPVPPNSGIHDLVFELINVTAKAPDGLVSIKNLELIYGQKSSKELQDYRQHLLELHAKADRTPVMKAKTPGFERITRVFDRGSWMVQTDTVQAAAPRTLLKNNHLGADRLALARWLVSDENPLTARVMANRIWEQLFGRGIVPTTEDFGTQAEPASHPKLLDYLAMQFMHEHQWSIKSLIKEILMSATYRQSSVVTEEKLEKDPFNEWLSRGPRFRLSAEQIRDQALFVSGLMDTTIGGKSVMPPQPEGIWQVIYNAQEWSTEEKDRYRRGLYTYWKRTSPYPSMVSFDSPSREFCVSRRIRTNTPLQALVTLNDPVYVEAAAALAEYMKNAGSSPEEAIRAGYKQALLKEPSTDNLRVLLELHNEAGEGLLSPVKVNSDQGPGEFITDPMQVVANAILNLDSFIMKE